MRQNLVLIIAVIAISLACDNGDGGRDRLMLMERVEGVMSEENLRTELEGITSMGHRMSGTPNEIIARDHVVRRFEALGLENVRTEAFPYISWQRDVCSLDLIDPEALSFDACALGFSPDTPVGGLEGEVVYVGTAMPADYEALAPADYIGKIHLVTASDEDVAHRTIQCISARLHHAAAFIHMTHREGEEGEALIEIGSTHYFNDIPAVAIDYVSGMQLRAFLEGDDPVKVRLDVCADQRVATSWNVIGEIPGAKEERVTVGAHYDSWDVGPCVIDNGSGVAAMLEMAKVIAALGPHERTVRFVAFGAEELGIQGSIAYGLKHFGEIRRLCRLMVNIDMVGTTHADLSITAVSSPLKCLVGELIEDTAYTARTGFEAAIPEIPALGTDCTPFVVLGVPTMSMGKYPFIYYHTEYDTMDKVDWDDLYASTLICAMAALRYADPGENF